MRYYVPGVSEEKASNKVRLCAANSAEVGNRARVSFFMHGKGVFRVA